jgi:ABC-2 type transport system ATP-binding protein
MLATALAALCLPAAAGAANVADNQVATSFDGTKIVYTLMTPDNASSANRVPAVLITHGYGGSRQTTPDGFVGDLLASGYAVLTWDQRGFGESGGQVEVDDPQVEARDVSALIDVLARDPRIARNGPGDPKVGMSGGSYAGGIQWVTAARDRRVDAIAPEISWHNLLESLIPSGVVKTGWGVALFGVGQTSVTGGLNPTSPAGIQTGTYDPIINQALAEGTATGQFSQPVRDFFAEKGPDYLLPKVKAPTFIIQGTIDTLFPPTQAVENWSAMKADHPGQPLKMAWYCSGHGTCSPFDPGPDGFIDQRIIAWFDRYVKNRGGTNTGPPFEYVTNDGVWHQASDYPVPGTVDRTGAGSGTVVVNGGPTTSGLLQGSEAPASLDIPIPSGPGTLIGAPHVTLTENGTGTATDEPNQATLFLQMVDTTTSNVIGNQVTPTVVSTDGSDHTYDLRIEPISYTIPAGDQVALEVASTSTSYEPYRGAAAVTIKHLQVSVPAVPAG